MYDTVNINTNTSILNIYVWQMICPENVGDVFIISKTFKDRTNPVYLPCYKIKYMNLLVNLPGGGVIFIYTTGNYIFMITKSQHNTTTDCHGCL